MVWVITIAVFLATVVAALLLFLIYSQKEQIKKAFKKSGRKNEQSWKLKWNSPRRMNRPFTKSTPPKTQAAMARAS